MIGENVVLPALTRGTQSSLKLLPHLGMKCDEVGVIFTASADLVNQSQRLIPTFAGAPNGHHVLIVPTAARSTNRGTGLLHRRFEVALQVGQPHGKSTVSPDIPAGTDDFPVRTHQG